MAKEIGEEYSSSLADLTVNSKPLINMLTILAEENVEHAAVIVQSVEKHLDKVHPDMKLPVLYLVDSIIKNVGGAYTQLFSQIIVNMFCRVFKQVNEDTRSQMFKLRHTWHDVFPSKKLYQLDVKVKQIDPAWPIRDEDQLPPTSNIHLNPNFLMKNSTAVNSNASVPASNSVPITQTEKEMLDAVALKEQELLLLQKKKIELKLKQTTSRLENNRSLENTIPQSNVNSETYSVSLPSAVVAVPPKPKKQLNNAVLPAAPAGSIRIAPVSPVLLNNRRRDPRLARSNHGHIPNVDSGSLQSVSSLETKQQYIKSDKNNRFGRSTEFNSDMLNRDDKSNNRQPGIRKDPRLNQKKGLDSVKSKSISKRSRSPNKGSDHRFTDKRKKVSSSPSRLTKLPPIPKIKKSSDHDSADSSSPAKIKKEPPRVDRNKKSKSSTLFEQKRSPNKINRKEKLKSLKYEPMDVDLLKQSSPPRLGVTFKELKTSTKERNYIRRNKEKSESPEKFDQRTTETAIENNASESANPSGVVGNGVTKKDVDLRLINKLPDETSNKKRPSADKRKDSPNKKNKTEKFDALFGDEDVDLRKLPLVDNLTPPPAPIISKEQLEENLLTLDLTKDAEGGWAKVKEIQSPHPIGPNKPSFAAVRAKLAEATKSKDPLGRPFLYKLNSDDSDATSPINPEDIDMRQQVKDLENDSLGSSIKTILSQAKENFYNGEMDRQQYNDLILQILQLSEAQKLKQAQQKDSFEMSKRRLNWVQKQQSKQSTEPTISDEDDIQGSYSPHTDEMENSDSSQSNFTGAYGDIDERIVHPLVNVPNTEGGKRPPLLPRPDLPYIDSDLRMHSQMSHYDKQDAGFIRDMRYSGRHGNPRMYGSKGWRGMRPRMDERAGFRPNPSRGLLPPPVLNRRNQNSNPRMQYDNSSSHPQIPPFVSKGPFVGTKQISNPLTPYSGKTSPPPLGTPSASRGLTPVDAKVLEYIDQDTMKTIHIDGTAREIRYYGKTAVIMLSWDDPREISFENGHRRIFFDDESFVLNFNEDYVNVTIDGQPHKIRYGSPTRELFIDDSWFECFFGGPSMPIMLDNKVKYIKLEGPPPQVSIGKVKRTDLVAGKINLIIDATTMHPVFLDAKLQKFEIENVIHTLRFVDSLQTILINEKPFKVEFGGLPKPLYVRGKKHFVRFSVLPNGITAGFVNIQNMEGKKPANLPVAMEIGNVSLSNIDKSGADCNPDTMSTSSSIKMDVDKLDTDVSGGLDMLASLLPSSMAPPSQYAGYSVVETDPPETNPITSNSIPGLEKKPDVAALASNPTSILQNLNVNDLFAKLVASGIVSTLNSTPAVPNTKTEVGEPIVKPVEKISHKSTSNVIKPVNLLKSETLKIRQPGLIGLLHTGMQCGSCGVRFPPEHTVRYSQHLDWHFRQNRADRHSQRRPNSRRWYYDISDWVQYQEIEDLEEREKSWFEREQQAAEAARTEEAAAVAARRETSSVPLKSDAPPDHLRCYLCHDSFHEFYNHDTDEWRLKNAVEFEGNNYHPICLDDHKASLIREQEKTTEEDNKTLIELDNTENAESETPEIENPPLIFNEAEPEVVDDVPQDDNADEDESIVEVLSEETATQESTPDDVPDVEVVEEDDDVVIKNEPVEQIYVDDVDTDEETERERQARDAQPDLPIDFANIKIKQEPIDPDDEPIITSEEVMTAQADTTHTAVLSSIDGNVQLEPTIQVTSIVPGGGIKINITKPLVNLSNKDKEPIQPEPMEVGGDEPPPPGEETEMVYKLKPTLTGKTFSIQPPTKRGSELSGLCSVM